MERREEVLRLPPTGETSLEGHLSFTGEPAAWAVVWVHGFGSHRRGEKAQALEAACARRGWAFAAFDFRGHGGSGGSLLELRGTSLLADLETAHAALVVRGIQRLCLVGSSLGGWASAWFALRHPELVPACVLIAPALNFLRLHWDKLSEAERLDWQQTGRLMIRNQWVEKEIGYGVVEEMDEFPVERLTAELDRPLLLIHGMQDDVVPYTGSLAFVEQTANTQVELHLLKSGGHRLSEVKEELAEQACMFLGQHVAGAAGV